MIALKTCAGNSRYLLPSRYDADAHVACHLQSRDLRSRRTGEEGGCRWSRSRFMTCGGPVHLLNELGFNSDWIEKCLAHEDGRSSRGVYNKAEYEMQRRHMMQEWSDIIDAWVAGKKRVPMLIPPSMPLLELDPALSPDEAPLRHVGMLRTGDWPGPPRSQPCLHFAEIPYDASRGKRKRLGNSPRCSIS